MRASEKLNAFLHPLMLKYVRHQYRKKLAVNRRKHPDVFAASGRLSLEAHKKLWSPLIGSVDASWLDMFYGISGNCDPRFVPEDVFYGILERCLNNCNVAGAQVEDKSNCCFYIPEANQPKSFVRFVRGCWFDGRMDPIGRDEAIRLLDATPDEVVGKPAMGSCGGANVACFKRTGGKLMHHADELTVDWIERNFEAYVVQERLSQESEVAAFNPSSLNTCRIVTFRRPWSGALSAIAGMLRFGCGGEIVDNLASGGVSADIDPDGFISDFAVDHDFGKVWEHPVTKRRFAGFRIPYYDRMTAVCCDVARKIPDFNLLSFDVVARPDGTPCIVEINATSMTLAQVQTQRPLFGEETERLIRWCVEHRRFDTFMHLRTWY